MIAVEEDVNFHAPIKSVSIENMVQQRTAVFDRLIEAIRLLHEASDIAAAAHVGFPRIEIEEPNNGRTPLLAPDGPAAAQREIDRPGWTYLIKESGLRSLMDAKARDEWDESLYNKKGSVPEFTLNNVKATFSTMYQNRADMFERGVIRCFKGLSWDFATNKPFRFGKRIILKHLFSTYGSRASLWMTLNHTSTNELDDLLRVFHVIDGKPEADHRNGMFSHIDKVHSADAKTMAWEGEYFSIKWFKKGTAHLTFKRFDLVDQLNDIIARHFPGALPAPRSV